MYMTLEYNPFATPAVPTELRMKLQGTDGPVPAVVTWGPWDKPARVDDDTMLLTCDVKINGVGGMAAFTMYGARITSIMTSTGTPVEIRSVRFSENREHPGFSVDGVPLTFVPGDPDNENIREYFCRKGLFVGEPKLCGALHMLPFDDDVGSERLEAFIKDRAGTAMGAFASAAVSSGHNNPYWLQCYLYAHPDHAAMDLACWQSKDKANKED